MNLILLGLACLLPKDTDEPVGQKTVQVRNTVYYKKASRLRGILRKAVYKEKVTVTAVKGRFSKCILKDGSEGWILSSALIATEKFKPGASTEAELKELRAEGFEAGRFNDETERQFRQEKGPRMDRAFKALDELEKRRPDPISREERLRQFRKGGKLGEFSPVKN